MVPSNNLPVRSFEKVLLTPTKVNNQKRNERANQRQQEKEIYQILFQNSW